MGNTLPKYPDSHRDEQVLGRIPTYSMRHRRHYGKWSSSASPDSLESSSSKYLDLQQHKELKACKFNSSYGFGTCFEESEASSEESDSYSGESYSSEESDSYSEEGNSSEESNSYSDESDSYSEESNSSEEENDSSPSEEINSSSEESDLYSKESSELVSDSDAEPDFEENDSTPEYYWRFDSNCDHGPYYEEKDFASGESLGLVSSSDNDDDSEKCSLLHKSKLVDENHLMLPNSEQSFSKTKLDIAKHLSDKNEHSVLLQFYEKFVDDLMEKLSIGYFDVCSSLQHMIRSHGDVVNGRLPSETDYCDKSFCIAYLHRYAACHSVMVSDSISTILKSSSNVLNKKLSKEQLKAVFLGGGPGNDFVGFLTALHSYSDHLLDLDVTVVDKMSGWQFVFNETVQKLKQSEYGQFYRLFNEVNIKSSFLSANLKDCEGWSIDMQNKLKKADLVFIVKVLSHISNDDKLEVLQNIIFHTKPGTLLIYIDHPYPKRAFESVSRALKPVYRSKAKRYNLKAKMLKFGYRNTTRCTAEVRVFQRC